MGFIINSLFGGQHSLARPKNTALNFTGISDLMSTLMEVYQSIVRKMATIFFYVLILEILISFSASAAEEGIVLYTPMEFKQVLDSRIENPFSRKVAISSDIDIIQADSFANLDEKTSVLHDKELGDIDELHVKGNLHLLGRIKKYPKKIFASQSLVINRYDESIGSIELAFKRCHNLQQQIPDNWSGIPFRTLMVAFDVSDKERCNLWLKHKRKCKPCGSCDCEVPVIGKGTISD